jgi:hypothetical protein
MCSTVLLKLFDFPEWLEGRLVRLVRFQVIPINPDKL